MLTTDVLSILEDSQHHPAITRVTVHASKSMALICSLGSTGILARLMSRRQLGGGEDEALRLRYQVLLTGQ